MDPVNDVKGAGAQFVREMEGEILARDPSAEMVWALAMNLFLNVIVNLYESDALTPGLRMDLRADLALVDKLARSANPRVIIATLTDDED